MINMKSILCLLLFVFGTSSTYGEQEKLCSNKVHSFIFDICDGECQITRFDRVVKEDFSYDNAYYVDYNFNGGPSITRTIVFNASTCKIISW